MTFPLDFTIKKYQELLSALKNAGYKFQPFADFIENPSERSIVLRHDVDAKKLNSLQFARIQAKSLVRGTYYFRIGPQSFDEGVIGEIASLGHEIGYHYETMETARGDVDKAYDEFCRNMEKFRKIVPVKTICMHGSPLSKYDNRSLWKKYDYKTLGLIGEPYFDIDFSKVLYLTDTGRRWDGKRVSIRDKVGGDTQMKRNKEGEANDILYSDQHSQNQFFHSTNEIINAAVTGNLPAQLMLTFHPQRWTDRPVPWVKELVWQNMKNLVKRFLVKL